MRARTCSTGSPAAGSTAWVAPSARLASRRPAAGSMATIVGSAGDAGALHDRLADAAAADHRHARAGHDPGGVEHRAEPGGHAAAEQRQLLVGAGRSATATTEPRRRPSPRRTSRTRRRRARAGRRRARTAASSAPTGPSSQWFDMPLRHHQQLPHAGDTDASTRSPTADPAHLGPDGLDRPAALVTGHDRQREVGRPGSREVGVADPLAARRTRTSRGPIAGVGRSSTPVARRRSYATATFTRAAEVSEHSLSTYVVAVIRRDPVLLSSSVCSLRVGDRLMAKQATRAPEGRDAPPPAAGSRPRPGAARSSRRPAGRSPRPAT